MHTGFDVYLGPAREARLWGSPITHWRLLPREPAAQSHLHHVSVSAWTAASSCGLSLTHTSGVGRQSQHMRNVAEELDPTFRPRRRVPEGGGGGGGGSGQTGTLHRQTQASEWTIDNSIASGSLSFIVNTVSGSQSLPITSSGMRDLHEEPTFIPPTKRQADKAARPKPKEKKENCKQQ